jgi:hypothetical protein
VSSSLYSLAEILQAVSDGGTFSSNSILSRIDWIYITSDPLSRSTEYRSENPDSDPGLLGEWGPTGGLLAHGDKQTSTAMRSEAQKAASRQMLTATICTAYIPTKVCTHMEAVDLFFMPNSQCAVGCASDL